MLRGFSTIHKRNLIEKNVKMGAIWAKGDTLFSNKCNNYLLDRILTNAWQAQSSSRNSLQVLH